MGKVALPCYFLCVCQYSLSLRQVSLMLPGHGGPNAADFVRQNLFDSLLKNPKFGSATAQALGEALAPHLNGAQAFVGVCFAEDRHESTQALSDMFSDTKFGDVLSGTRCCVLGDYLTRMYCASGNNSLFVVPIA